MNKASENKMGTMPMFRLIVTMSVPIIISMLVQALYNVVDSIFVARYSQDALAAVSYAFPAQNLLIGFATGLGVGINALLSKSLGEKNYKKVNRTAGNGILLEIIAYLIFLVFGIFFVSTFIRFQTSTESIITEGSNYLTICCIFSFGIFGEITFERLLQATGRTLHTMFTQGLGAVLNIILDPIFIFGYFGLPAMGAKGAAIATVIGQIAAFILAVILNFVCNKDVHITKDSFVPDKTVIGQIFGVGIPAILMVGIGSLMTTGMNKILNEFSDLAVSVFGVYFKLQSLAFMPVFGLNNAVTPIVSYNYGAKHRKRIMTALKMAIGIATTFMLVYLFCLQMFPDKALMLFDASEEMLSIGVPALRIASISYIFAGFCIVVQASFQAFGKGVFSMCISFARQIVVLLPVAYLLSLSGNLELVWWAYPIAEIASVITSSSLFMVIYKTIISKLPEE